VEPARCVFGEGEGMSDTIKETTVEEAWEIVRKCVRIDKCSTVCDPVAVCLVDLMETLDGMGETVEILRELLNV